MLWRSSIRNYRLALETLVVVVIIVALRALLFALGVTDLDKVVDAAVASAQTETEADSNRER